MKAETSASNPKFNLLQGDGDRPEVEVQEITQVLLNDGAWYSIEPGSFHFYQAPADSSGKRTGVPFVQFDLKEVAVAADGSQTALRVEVFPATVAGWAYPVAVDTGLPEQPQAGA
jgi:hypothetical protein